MIIQQYVYAENPEKLTIACMGDFHLGHIGCDKEKLKKDLEWIKNQKHLLVYLMGDFLDIQIPYIAPEKHVVYSEIDRDLDTFEKGYNYLVELLIPIKRKIMGIHLGNHDFQWIQKTQFNYVKNLANELNAPYLNFEALTKLLIGTDKAWRKRFDIYSVHGSYSGRKIGGKLNRLTEIASSFDADIYIMAHVHELGGWRTVKIGLDQHMKIVEKKQAYVFSGTYFKAHVLNASSYAERRQYPPNKIGLITIEIYPRQRDIHVKE